MIKYKQNILRVLITILPVLFLTACGDYDFDLLETAFRAWAENNDVIVDGKYKPQGVVAKAVEDTLGEITNREENVQFNGLDVIRDIETADKLANEALVDFDISKISSAVSIRPLDWRLREQEAVVWLGHDNGAAAQTAFTESDELLKKGLKQGGDCAVQRRLQLETRIITLWEAVKTYESQPGRSQNDATELRREHSRVGKELKELNQYNISDFCGLDGGY